MKKKIYIFLCIVGIIILIILSVTVFSSIFPRCGGTSYGGASPTCDCTGIKVQRGFPWGPIYCVGIRTKCYAFSGLHTISQKNLTQDKNTTTKDVEVFLKKIASDFLIRASLVGAATTTSTGMIKTGEYKIIRDYNSTEDNYFKYNTEVTCQSYDTYFEESY
jgi:hypothetical protein